MMLVKEIMTRDVQVIPPRATVQEAAQRMKECDIGVLPVCDGERLAGMLTDRDITVVSTAEGMDPAQTEVGEVMTPDVVYCFEDQPLEAAASLMEEKKVRRLAVLNRKKRLVGIVSIGDLAERSHNDLLSGEVLEKVSQPVGSDRPDVPKPPEPKKIQNAAKIPNIPTETHL